MKKYFDVNSTLRIKGIAIILMVCNHLFPIDDWIYPENRFISIPVGSKTIAAYIGGFSKICVAMYALLTGLGMYYVYSKKSLRGGYSHTIKKLPRFFATYWVIILLIYVPVMLVSKVFIFDIKEFLMNLFGYQTTYCKIAWYVRFYFELVLSFPVWVMLYRVLNKMIKKNTSIALVILVLIQWSVGSIANVIAFPGSQFVMEYFSYIPIVMTGYYIGEQNVFYKISLCLEKTPKIIKSILCICILLMCFIARGMIKQIKGFNLDIIYAPLVIAAFWQIIEILPYHKIIKSLEYIGKYSLEIWFLHAIFFIGNSTVQKVAYWPKVSVFILIWVFFLLLPIAAIIQKIVNILVR